MTSAQEKAFAATGCDVRFDNLTRQLFATDASIYQIEPIGVAFPRSARQASAVIRAAADGNISVTPRGAGTSLVGNAIGEGLIVDFSRYNRQITDLGLEKRTVRVGAGVVLDQLNAFLKPHGFCFGPDVATSSRATLGGMIANNSSGAHVPVYGTTADHVVSTEIVLVDGRILNVGPTHNSLGAEREKIDKLIRTCVAEISERMPPGLLKRWPGYGLERFLRAPDNLNEILAGSEGTLAAIFSAELKISPLPCEKGLGLIFFDSVDEAMEATVELLDLKPAAIEHIDRPLLDQTKSQLHFQAARDLLELDSEPCESILLVEFYEDVAERLSLLQSRRLGLRTKICRDAHEMDLVWSVRKAGLSLLTGCVGAAKPVAFIEDAAVRPAQLPAYVAGLKSIMKPLGLEASYYGHAASGLLHVRPVLDLHSAADLKKFRRVANETSALVRQFKGSLSAEHGVGTARTEYMREQLGDELLGVMREIKHAFDPKNIFNPGKIFEAGSARCADSRTTGQRGVPTKIDNHLRENFTKPLELPFEPRLAFAFKDGSFIGNLEQCNGCGGCRKDTPIMCPTFIATGEEIMSTRGRANIIRAALELRFAVRQHVAAFKSADMSAHSKDPLRSAELDAALSNCLSCKGCTPECPSNVNLALLKAEMLYARHQRDGLPLRERIFSNVDLLGQIGCATPRILWDDTFVRYHEPHIGRAAVKVLEALDFEVELVKNRKCCGRPAFSQGNLDAAAKAGKHNVDLLNSSGSQLSTNPASPSYGAASNSQLSSTPILFLEPSCWSMFVDDYRELKIDNAEKVAARCFLFEKFIDDLLDREPDALQFKDRPASSGQDRHVNVTIHPHCHAKSLINPAFMARLVERLPGRKAQLLDTGCCGMAGAFGALAEKYQLSVQVAADLLGKIDNQPAGSEIVASGTSCRHQIVDLSNIRPKHMAELLAEAID